MRAITFFVAVITVWLITSAFVIPNATYTGTFAISCAGRAGSGPMKCAVINTRSGEITWVVEP